MAMDFSKPERKKLRTFSLSPHTSDLINQAATAHDVSASRIVDKALEHYLTHVLLMAPTGAAKEENEKANNREEEENGKQ